jgi:hypothetical protein
MTQADSVLSTPPTNTSAKQSRRSILGAIAAGSIAAMVSTIAEPATATGAFPVDPIFAAIEAHRKAYATMHAVFAEYTRAHELADAEVGPDHLDISSMIEPGTTVRATCWIDIERAVPKKQYPELYARHCRALENRQDAHRELVESLLGDEDEATDEVAGPELRALDAFEETIPTTLPGLMAMIVYAGECSENNADAFADRECPLIENLAIAAKALIGSRA